MLEPLQGTVEDTTVERVVVTDAPTDMTGYRALIESALKKGADWYTFEDLAERVRLGAMQFWPGVTSVILTEVQPFPRKKVLHCFLSAGNQKELAVMGPPILRWARAMGCTEATLYGRPGWERSVFAKLGFKKLKMIAMSLPLEPWDEGDVCQ